MRIEQEKIIPVCYFDTQKGESLEDTRISHIEEGIFRGNHSGVTSPRKRKFEPLKPIDPSLPSTTTRETKKQKETLEVPLVEVNTLLFQGRWKEVIEKVLPIFENPNSTKNWEVLFVLYECAKHLNQHNKFAKEKLEEIQSWLEQNGIDKQKDRLNQVDHPTLSEEEILEES